ncbi:MAG: FAD:protein FMN transferase [Planctomycetes bacterium]|nr:FAD:protein FMN transferase [Planctomycetota bacterium]
MSRRSSRRDFLKGKAAARAVADLAQKALPEEGPNLWPTDAGDESALIRVSRRAMACEFEVLLAAGRHEAGTEASLEALDLVEALEEQMSVFRPTSEICRLNRTCAAGPVEVDSRLFELLELAFELNIQTDGALDVTAGPLGEAWGFARRAGAVPDDETLARARQNVGGHLVELDGERQTVRFRHSGVELNLGCIGKGYALDRAAELLSAAGIDDFLLHGGQSSILARGSSRITNAASTDAKSFGWVVGIPHPIDRSRRLAELRLRDRGLGTSGSGTQHFRHQGRRYGHILDPRTGRPAEGVLSVTVLAPTAARADALSTAFFVMGVEKSLEFCASRPEIGAVLLQPGHGGSGVEVHSTGLEDDELRILDPPSRDTL